MGVLRSVTLGLAAAAFALAITGAAAQKAAPAGDAGLGTWKLNPSKSKFNPGNPPANFTTSFEPAGKAVKVTMTNVAPDGKSSVSGYTAEYNGKDVPLTGSRVADTTALRRLDPYTTERVDKKGGKVMQTLVRTVAKDGKSFTVTVKGVNEKGEKVDHVAVFEKQ